MSIDGIYNDIKELLTFRYKNGIIVIFKKSLSFRVNIKTHIEWSDNKDLI